MSITPDSRTRERHFGDIPNGGLCPSNSSPASRPIQPHSSHPVVVLEAFQQCCRYSQPRSPWEIWIYHCTPRSYAEWPVCPHRATTELLSRVRETELPIKDRHTLTGNPAHPPRLSQELKYILPKPHSQTYPQASRKIYPSPSSFSKPAEGISTVLQYGWVGLRHIHHYIATLIPIYSCS